MLDKPSAVFNPELVSYKNTANEALKLHVFEPTKKFKDEKKTCIVYFSGEGWKVGTPLQFYREAAYFASKCIVAITADYRTEFDNGTTVFEIVSDAKSAIRWIRENAENTELIQIESLQQEPQREVICLLLLLEFLV